MRTLESLLLGNAFRYGKSHGAKDRLEVLSDDDIRKSMSENNISDYSIETLLKTFYHFIIITAETFAVALSQRQLYLKELQQRLLNFLKGN